MMHTLKRTKNFFYTQNDAKDKEEVLLIGDFNSHIGNEHEDIVMKRRYQGT